MKVGMVFVDMLFSKVCNIEYVGGSDSFNTTYDHSVLVRSEMHKDWL
jgi:hypothetical protein